MKVWFQSKLYKPINGNASSDPTFGNNKNVKVDSIIFKTPVIWNGSTVVGCPKSWNSTLPYCPDLKSGNPAIPDNRCCTFGYNSSTGLCN